MTDDLPLRWIEKGPADLFQGEACRGEFYAFQIGVFASGDPLENVTVQFGDFKGNQKAIPASALRCFNCGGTDWLGRPFKNDVYVPRGQVQPLWIGVQVPRDANPGMYEGTVTIHPANAAATAMRLELTVVDKLLEDGGDSDLWKHSRLRWLDSTIGLDDEVLPPFTPVQLKDNVVEVLGRRATFDKTGMLTSIASTFNARVDGVDAPPCEILAGPMRLAIDDRVWSGQVKVTDKKSGAVSWEANSTADGLEFRSLAKMECDGYVNYKLTLRAKKACDLRDVALEIPLRRDAATYMMGMGRKGGYRPKEWEWKWDVNRANSQVWIGDVNAGLSLKLKHLEDRWDLYNLIQSGTYRDWSNNGKGGCTIHEDGDRVVVRAYTGARQLAAGESLQLNFGLLITPLKILDRDHWNWRYFHTGDGYRSVKEIAPTGCNIINIHQGNGLNPHINYPFDTVNKFAAYTKEAHERGLKVKTYYTVRELSNYTTELWALRSLGKEIFLEGAGFKLADHFQEGQRSTGIGGNSWLREHVVDRYVPAWHTPIGAGHYDASLAMVGLSRWHNYYLEGLDWLIRNAGCDGLYLDGVGYDREIMKRVRKVMQRAKPGCLIDFHSGNNFDPAYGLNSPANQYLELFPYIDSLWLGEGFNPGESPDYWLVEMSGMPFGLFSEMLQGGGNPWRGMIYGMTTRFAWSGDPRPFWKLWDEFGIKDARMSGYWDPACPVKTNHKDVLATCYIKDGKTLVAVANCSREAVPCRLTIDWKALGVDPKKAHLYLPDMVGLQSAALYDVTDEIPIEPNKGCLLIIDEEKHEAPPRKLDNVLENRKLLFEDRFDRAELGPDWKTAISPLPETTMKLDKSTFAITGRANSHAFVERTLPAGCTLAECRIFTGDDGGAAWGPGLAFVWKNKTLRVNARADGRFGIDINGGQDGAGVTEPQKWFHVRIRIEKAEVVVEGSRNGTLWYRLYSLPRNQLDRDPLVIRVGKMNAAGAAGDSSPPGNIGACAISDVRVYGAK